MYFSVIIPLFNKEKHIVRALRSVLKQTYQNFEVIVVNDGSTDEGVEKVKRIKDKKIRLIHQKNAGVSVARNNGINNANFEYIAFLDADDAWKPKFLETIVNLIRNYPKSGAYATAYELIKKEGSLLSSTFNSFEQNWEGIVEDYFKESFNTPLISASSVVIPSNVFKEVGGFPKGITRGEDLDMWARIALKYNIAFSNKSLAIYYMNAENMATNKKKVYANSFMSYAEEMLIKGKKQGNSSVFFEEYMIKVILNKVRYLIEQKRYSDAKKILREYKHTKYNRKSWLKNYLLSCKYIHALFNKIK